MLVRALALLAAFSLTGCSMTELLNDGSSKDMAGSEPAMTADLANRMAGVIAANDRTGKMEVSVPRRAESDKGPSWLYCVRTLAEGWGLPRYYAVFVQYDKVVQSRLSVLIDQCELQSFTALNVVRDAVVPATELERKQQPDQLR
jgi:hypothetical protein